MEHACIRQTELPNTTKLFADTIYHPERVKRFFSNHPSDPATFAAAAARIQFPDDRRTALVAALRKQNGDHPLLAKLARPGTVAVLTGQQVGLFSGPAYTVYKALTAVRLAEELSEQGIPAVPVFWLATEDHDFPEVNQVWLFDQHHTPVKLTAAAEQHGTQPVGNVVIENPRWEEAAAVLNGLPFEAEALELIRKAYQPGRTFGEAFAAIVDLLVGRFGLLKVNPMAPEIRELGAPLLRDAVLAAPDLTEALLARTKELTTAGYHAQVHVEKQTSLFFLLKDGQRLNLRRQNGGYASSAGKISTEELAAQADHLSPNALLRPVMQDFLFPTVAYVGGPAELAYLAQSQVLYQSLLGRELVAVHRAGFTLLDHRAAKLMERYHLTLPDFFHGEEPVRGRIGARLTPASVSEAAAHSRRDLKLSLDRLSSELQRFDHSLDAALATSRRKIEYQMEKIERKVAREALLRDERATADAGSLSGLLYPHKHMQERLYSILPFIAKHGTGVIDQVFENLRLDCPDHQLLLVE